MNVMVNASDFTNSLYSSFKQNNLQIIFVMSQNYIHNMQRYFSLLKWCTSLLAKYLHRFIKFPVRCQHKAHHWRWVGHVNISILHKLSIYLAQNCFLEYKICNTKLWTWKHLSASLFHRLRRAMPMAAINQIIRVNSIFYSMYGCTVVKCLREAFWSHTKRSNLRKDTSAGHYFSLSILF